MGNRVEAAPTLGDHRLAPAVPGRHVGGEGAQVALQAALPAEPVVREEHRLVDPERDEALGARGGLPVVARQDLVVAREGRQAGALAAAALADGVGLARGLHVRHREDLVAPDDAHVPLGVVREADRLASQGGIDVLLPEPAVLEEVLVGVDHRLHRRPRARSSRGRSMASP